MPTSVELADRLVALAHGVLVDLEAHHAPGLELPRVFGGHAVGPDARADLAFTLGLLHAEGIEEVAGVDGASTALEIVRRLDGPATHSFYSYRAAETLLRLGGLDDNPRLARWTEDDHRNVEAAIDSSSMLRQLDDGALPRNFAVVLTRCEVARRALDRLPAGHRLDELLDHLRALFGGLPHGWWDDFGGANYDMYTPDVYLFAEPFADALDPVWTDGLTSVLDDLADVATPGGAVAWGRSTGALGIVMNVELGAVAVGRSLGVDPAAWLGKASQAVTALEGWFSEGVVVAHQHRMTMAYRGPERRLQMTLDLLGKLVQAAHELRRGPLLEAASPAASYGAVDRFVPFEDERHAGVWTHRGGGIEFVLPLVGGVWGDYSPAPRWPGRFEVVVDSGRHIGWLPQIHADGAVRSVTGPPKEVHHDETGLTTVHDGYATLEFDAPDEARVPVVGERRATYRVEGRSLVVEDSLTIDRAPDTVDAIVVAVPEVDGHPLRVEFETDLPHTSTVVDTRGMQAHRSFWSEHARLHELVIEPATRVDYRCRITPPLRLASTAHQHWYDRSLWDPLGDRVLARPAPLQDPEAMAAFDVVHVHWPEWASGLTAADARRTIDVLRAAGVTILWTQHNRAPHFAQDAIDMYAVWAAEADLVIHHSHYGRALMEAQYRYGDHTVHAVIPHGHWGHRLAPVRPRGGRAEAERELGMGSAGLRLGMVGAPRSQKDTQMVLDAVHASDRDDIELWCWSLHDEVVPDDPRIHAFPYEMTEHHVYAKRLFTLDVLVLPFAEGMLTTGTVADAIGAGIPAICSPWGYLREAMGDAGIYYDGTLEGLVDCLDGLGDSVLAEAQAAIPGRRAALDWGPIARTTFDLVESVVVAR